jgi:2-ketoarginine methyltransferase
MRTAKTVGVKRLLRLQRAHRDTWEGLLDGFYTTRAIQTLLNVGFLDEVERKGSVDVESFARSNNLDPDVLRALCEALFAMRVLKLNGHGYALDRKGKMVLEVARGWFDISYGYEEVFHNLEGLLKKTKRYGSDVHRRGDYVARGSGEIENWVYFPLAIEMVRNGGFKRVLDLGCGDGTFLREMCRNLSGVTGYGLDLAPDAIALGERLRHDEGLDGRVHLHAADVCEMETLPNLWRDIDLGITFFVLHEVRYAGGEAVVHLLRSFRRLFPNVPLIVFEAIRPTAEQMRARPGMSVHYFMYHDLTHQKPVSREEWRDLFKAAGFSSIEERWLPFARTSIFTCR